MIRTAGILSLALLLVAVAAESGQAQAAAAPEKTIWDGVYTDAQATRGQRAAQQNCGACHAPAEWSNSRFIGSWAGRSIGDLHTQIRTTMPFDSPGRLTPQQYADIVAYILKLNDAPAGEAELPGDAEGLRKIGVTRKASR